MRRYFSVLETHDPEFARSLRFVIENDPAPLELTFSFDFPINGYSRAAVPPDEVKGGARKMASHAFYGAAAAVDDDDDEAWDEQLARDALRVEEDMAIGKGKVSQREKDKTDMGKGTLFF